MSTPKECPLLWTRTDLDAFLLFEAASRGDIAIFTEEPDVAERERLTRSGQVIIWDEAAVLHLSSGSGKLVKTRWHHTVPWSASRMIRNYLVRPIHAIRFIGRRAHITHLICTLFTPIDLSPNVP